MRGAKKAEAIPEEYMLINYAPREYHHLCPSSGHTNQPLTLYLGCSMLLQQQTLSFWSALSKLHSQAGDKPFINLENDKILNSNSKVD